MSSKNINEMEKYFLSGAALKSFGFQDDVSDAWYYSLEGQMILLERTVCHPLVKQLPLNHFYMKNFLKAVITQLESKNYEVLDDIYTTYCELLKLQDLDIHYKHYVVNKNKVKAFSLMESSNIVSCGTTGLCTWQAALALAEWGLQNQEFLRNKRVLELGSGIGFSGIAIAICCETQCFCFSDVHPEVLRRLKTNIVINTKSDTPGAIPTVLEKLDSGNGANTSDSDIMLTAYANDTEIHVLNLPWENVDKSKALQTMEPFDVILAAGKNELVVEEQLIPKANNFIFSNEVPIILYKISSYG